ncbi:MAG: MFS transporter, partial [Dehalococcoidia bacterium]
MSAVGTSITELALPLLVLTLRHSVAAAGFVAALHALPAFVLMLPAGALVDRWDRKRMMFLCDVGRALSLASIPLAIALGHISLGQICAVALIEG